MNTTDWYPYSISLAQLKVSLKELRNSLNLYFFDKIKIIRRKNVMKFKYQDARFMLVIFGDTIDVRCSDYNPKQLADYLKLKYMQRDPKSDPRGRTY